MKNEPLQYYYACMEKTTGGLQLQAVMTAMQPYVQMLTNICGTYPFFAREYKWNRDNPHLKLMDLN